VALFIFVWFTFKCVSMCILYLVKEQSAFALMSANSSIGSPNSQFPIRLPTSQSPRYRLPLERDCLMASNLLLQLRNSTLLCNCVEVLCRNLPYRVVSQSACLFDSSYQTYTHLSWSRPAAGSVNFASKPHLRTGQRATYLACCG
jgi:hypothetical protein